MMYPSRTARNWRVVAEEVSREHDPEKMGKLMRELLQALDEEHKPKQSNAQNTRSPRDLSRTA